MRGGLVLLSGGLDSAVTASIASSRFGVDRTLAVVFDYGQRHDREIYSARMVASRLGLELLEVSLDSRKWGGSALTDDAIDVPTDGGDSEIPATYVPARNLVFLSIGVGIAEARELDAVYIGVNAIDYSGYPDCRPEFIESFQKTGALALKRGVEGDPVRIETPLIAMTKGEIVRLGTELGAPLDVTWSCYMGGDRPCGECDACRLRAAGFADAGLDDPAAGSRAAVPADDGAVNGK